MNYETIAMPSVGDLKNLRAGVEEIEKGVNDRSDLDALPTKLIAPHLSLIIGTMKHDGYNLGLVRCRNSRVRDEDLEKFSVEVAKANYHHSVDFIDDGNFCFAKGFYKQEKGKVIFTPHCLDALLEVQENE